MYTKQEASALRQQFWTKLGIYLSPIPSASGEKVNWINYKTGVKAIRFKMDADSSHAFILIEVTGKTAEERESAYTLLRSFKPALEEIMPGGLTWAENFEDEFGGLSGRVTMELQPANIFSTADWPAMISFFKEGMIALDEFWADYKEIFEMSS
ncbi:MAG: hypothetical protein JWQ27_2067 [Ferruginibacter sp.]|nr:hypothetical protein [Ferruginibacter sp.]